MLQSLSPHYVADGFVANRNGSMVNGSGCDRELNAQILFNCDPNAPWNLESTDISKYRENFIRNPTDACEVSRHSYD